MNNSKSLAAAPRWCKSRTFRQYVRPRRCPEALSVDLPAADIRHALHDVLQKATVGELDVVERPTVRRAQDALEDFAVQETTLRVVLTKTTPEMHRIT